MSSSTLAGAAQTNGVSASQAQGGGESSQAQASQSQGTATQPNTTQATQSSTAVPATQTTQSDQPPTSPSATAIRPRDQRTLELLLTAQGVTAFEHRIPLLLLDFAYRHTSAILSDALHLAADPYTSQAGSKPSASSGAVPVAPGEAPVTANAVQLAIASRLGFQYRGGGGGAGGGGASKDWLMELAKERNKVALPRVAPTEWGVRLPSERFVLTGTSWGLRDVWAGAEEDDDDNEDEDEEMPEINLGGAGAEGGGDAMEGVEEVGGEDVEGGTAADIFGDDVDDDMMED
ncbi:TFIID-31kDa-domain-containing protein [Thozetella sp. PMI_491]|nr:TFIID-31kDa-domain-containing protein [Thozetella sp. PMI_491]